MAGKKRKLKKELKRKLRKETKKKETKADERKTEKQVYDNQTLQQLMMAQMMSSRARVSNGEGSGWITAQNQANADRIQYQQQLNAMKATNKELKRQVDDVEANEKFKDMKDKYENERKALERKIEELNEMREQAEKVKPLNDEIERLKREIAEQEKELKNPVRDREMKVEELEIQLKYLREKVKKGDPEERKTMEEIAKAEQYIEKLNKRKQKFKNLEQLKEDQTYKEAQLKEIMKNLREKIPELKGERVDGKTIDELIMELTHKATMAIDERNKQIEMLDENGNMVRTLNQTRDTRDKVEENFRKAHPLFNPILDAHLNALGENSTLADKTKALGVSMETYGMDLADNMMAMFQAHAAINNNLDYTITEKKFGEILTHQMKKSPVYKAYTENDPEAQKMRELIRTRMYEKYNAPPDETDYVLSSMVKGELPTYYKDRTVRFPEWYIRPFDKSLTFEARILEKAIDDEVKMAQFGPGTEGVQQAKLPPIQWIKFSQGIEQQGFDRPHSTPLPPAQFEQGTE